MCEFAGRAHEASHESFGKKAWESCEWRKEGARVLGLGLDSWLWSTSWPKSQQLTRNNYRSQFCNLCKVCNLDLECCNEKSDVNWKF